MNDILLVTIPAALVLVATLGARFVEHYLQGKREAGRQKLEREREIREVRRKYRESMVTPVREALTKLQASLESQSMVDYLSKKAKEQDISLELKTITSIERLKKHLQRNVVSWEVFTEFVPLAAGITNEKVREHVEWAFLCVAAGKQIREGFNITEQDMKETLNLAYQKLEDFVTLADKG